MAINTEIPINKVEIDDQEIRLEEPNLITKEITENGTYNATDDNADGYSSVVVNIESGGGNGGEEEMKQETFTGDNWYDAYQFIKEKALEYKLVSCVIDLSPSYISANGLRITTTLNVGSGTVSETTEEATFSTPSTTAYLQFSSFRMHTQYGYLYAPCTIGELSTATATISNIGLSLEGQKNPTANTSNHTFTYVRWSNLSISDYVKKSSTKIVVTYV